MIRLAVILFAVLGGPIGFCQDTSPWIRVKSSDEAKFGTKPIQKGSQYVNLSIVHTSLTDKSNWYSNLASGSKKAMVSYELKITDLGGTSLEDRRSSEPVLLPRNPKKPYGIAWSPMVMTQIPSSFETVSLTISIGSAAKDNLDELLSSASALSSQSPIGVTNTSLVTGYVSGAKKLLDIIFDKELVKTYMKSNKDLISFGDLGKLPGLYVVFGAEKKSDYSKYTVPEKLLWNGASLSFDGAPIVDVNYCVIQLETVASVYPTLSVDVLTGRKSGWAASYRAARRKILEITSNDSNKNTQFISEIRAFVLAARLELDEDYSFIESEKEKIEAFFRKLINDELNTRIKSFDPGAPLVTLNEPSETSFWLRPIFLFGVFVLAIALAALVTRRLVRGK